VPVCPGYDGAGLRPAILAVIENQSFGHFTMRTIQLIVSHYRNRIFDLQLFDEQKVKQNPAPVRERDFERSYIA
jgi:hypothetical protein